MVKKKNKPNTNNSSSSARKKKKKKKIPQNLVAAAPGKEQNISPAMGPSATRTKPTGATIRVRGEAEQAGGSDGSCPLPVVPNPLGNLIRFLAKASGRGEGSWGRFTLCAEELKYKV